MRRGRESMRCLGCGRRLEGRAAHCDRCLRYARARWNDAEKRNIEEARKRAVPCGKTC
jgi:hypothetical protein